MVNDRSDFTIVNDFDVTTSINEFSGSHTDFFNFTTPAIDNDDITNLEFTFKDDEDTS